MKRWYYDDPLAAAWMAQHFGMEFHREGYPNRYKEDFSDWYGCGLSEVMYGKGFGKFYVHPDSLHLLEPKELDVGNDAKRNLMIFLDGHWRDWGNDECALNMPHKIIQRNGIPFHWPLSEEV